MVAFKFLGHCNSRSSVYSLFETLSVNQFTSELQLKLLSSDQVNINDVFKETKLTFRWKKLAAVSSSFVKGGKNCHCQFERRVSNSRET